VIHEEIVDGFVFQGALLTRIGQVTRMHSLPKKYTPVYLERMVERKKAEVDNLMRRHQAQDDPLLMRMSYMASECKYDGTFVSVSFSLARFVMASVFLLGSICPEVCGYRPIPTVACTS